MKKILKLNLVILSLMFLVTGCAGKKKDAPAPDSSNLTEPTAPVVKNSMRLIDRIKYTKEYVGEVGEVPQENIAKVLASIPLDGSKINAANLKKDHDEFIKPYMREAVVTFSKEGEFQSALVAATDKKGMVICADVKSKKVEKEDTKAIEAEITVLGKQNVADESLIALNEVRLKEISEMSAAEGAKDEVKAESEALKKATEELKTKVAAANIAKASKEAQVALATTVKIESDTLCYTFDKAELNKEIKSENRFSQEKVHETRYDSEGKTVSEGTVTVKFDINKDGSQITNGSIEREGKDANNGMFPLLRLKSDDTNAK